MSVVAGIRPPYSEDAERAALGAMLLAADAIVRAVELVDETMFYREPNRRIFRAMLALHRAGSVIDPVTLPDQLERQGDLAAIGGREYIGELLYDVPTAANVEYHLKIVKRKALERRLLQLSEDVAAEVATGQMEPTEISAAFRALLESLERTNG
ncbi:MAG: replicative DNA helicase, partial [Gemmatimonadetes bacterium]|nr:replicative DNA helicase [Gemmatimonadota bacterium]